MKKVIFVIVAFLSFQSFAVAGIKLTDEQFKNIDVIHKVLKAKDSNFIGLNGRKDDMRVVGVMSEAEVLKEIGKINIKAEIAKDPGKIKKEKIKKKFKTAGFDDEMLEFIGF